MLQIDFLSQAAMISSHLKGKPNTGAQTFSLTDSDACAGLQGAFSHEKGSLSVSSPALILSKNSSVSLAKIGSRIGAV